MEDLTLIETLGQVSSSEAGSIFRNFLRGGVRQMICEVMAAEVNELCDPQSENQIALQPPRGRFGKISEMMI